MSHASSLNRRTFIRTSIASAVAAGASVTLARMADGAIVREGAGTDAFRGLKVGIASYSLRKFSLDQAIAMTKQAGVRHITLKDFHLALKSSPDERKAARQKIEAAGLKLMGGGVIYMKKNEAEIRAAFEYAKDAGMPVIVCSPDIDALPTVERFVKEYDIVIAIHNHGPGDAKYPSPVDVMRLVKDLDSRMGICMDVGHTVRINQDPVKVMKACASRLYDYHIKDVTAATEKGASTEMGRGVIDLVAVLKSLLKMKYSWHLALEYEDHADAPMPGIQECFGYMRGVLAAI